MGLTAFVDAAEPERITDDGKLKFTPVYRSRDEIVFAVHESPNLVCLKRLDLKDRSQTRLHPAVAAHQFDPAFSADGRYHCFVMSSGSPQMHLVIQDAQEKSEHDYRPREARAVARVPTIAPDGKRVAFSVSDVNGHQIGSVDMQGKDLRLLTQSSGINHAPAYSPDGRRIAFSSSREGDFDLYVMEADGSNVTQLFESPGLDERPAWSPDGQRIAFTSNRDGNYEIYLLELASGTQRKLTDHPEKDDFATWHPDGKRVLFVSSRDGKSDLYQVAVGE